MILKVDNYVGYIDAKLKKAGLKDILNVIYVSDHGMDRVIPVNFIDVTKFLKNDTYAIYGSSPVLQVVPKAGNLKIESRYQTLS